MGTPPAISGDTDALFLDFDGTLVALAPRPDAIQVPDDLPSLLRAASERLDGRLVVVSGRSLATLDRHLNGCVRFAAGIHGGEILDDGPPVPDALLDAALDSANRYIARDGAGLLVEEKGLAVALHYRERPDLAGLAHRLAETAVRESEGVLAIQTGHMVVELKPAGWGKHRAVRHFMGRPDFAGSRPVFAGDDLTDEAGFEEAAARGGYGVLVSHSRPTLARYELPGPDAVRHWIRELVESQA